MNSVIKVISMVLIVVASVAFSSSMVSGQATGNVSYSPTVFSSDTTILVMADGGSFGSGSTVYFYISTTTSSTGIVGGTIGSIALPAGSTTLADAHLSLNIPTLSPGTYYLLASDSSSPSSSGAQFSSPTAVTVSTLKPSVSIAGSQPTTLATVSGSGWDPSSLVSLYLAGPQGSSIYSVLLTSFTVTASGSIPTGASFTIPEIAGGSYVVVAQESSSSSPNYGITSDSSLSISPLLVVSPYDIGGSVGSQFNVAGYGFPSLATITADGIFVGSTAAVNAAETASSEGSFSVSASLSIAITTPGPYSVTVKYNSTSYSQSNTVFVSIPNDLSLGFTFIPKISYAYPGTPYSAEVYDFPASSQVYISLGPVSLGTVTTDSNGFGTIQGNIPAIPAGTYYATASSGGLYSSVQVTVSAYFVVEDPDGIQMVSNTEYFPSTGHYTVYAYGLSPSSIYTFSDSAKSSHYSIGQVQVGTLISSSRLEFSPALNGTLIFSFSPNFTSSASTSTITLIYSGGSVTGYLGNTYGYTAAQPPYFSISHNTVSLLEQGISETVTVYGIVPVGSVVYPGLGTSYNIYIGSIELSFDIGSGTTATSVLSSSFTSQAITFTVPAVSSGVYFMNITYSGSSASSPLYSAPVVISTPASSLNSGGVTAIPIYSAGEVTGYYVAGYSFFPSATVKLYYYTQSSLISTTEGLTYGGFVFSGLESLSSIQEPAGTYGIIAQASYQSSTYSAYSSYAVYPSLSLSALQGTMGSQVAFTVSGLSPGSYYSIRFGTLTTLTFQTSDSGYAQSTFTVPTVPPGNYSVGVVNALSSSVVSGTSFNVVPSPTLELIGGGYAFPGQVVNYSWKPSSSPGKVGASSSGYYGNIYVTAYLNGSALSTTAIPMMGGYLNGSFTMPNDPPGTYWSFNLSWEQNIYTTNTISSSVETTVVSTSTHYMSPANGAFVKLISGNGALLTGISQGQIAQITAAVNSSISASLQIPLSELDASISSINGTIAYLKTSFGTMESSLSSLNATIVALNGTVVTLRTTLGTVKTSLSSLNATVTVLSGNTADIKTSVGALTGNVTSISGNVATIKTSLGTLQATVGNVTSKASITIDYGLYIDIALGVLIVITLVISIIDLLAVRNIAKRWGIKKE